MSGFVETLRQRLERIRAQDLWRELRRVDAPQGPWIEMGGRRLLNFSSNDYLGLANHAAVRAAAAEAAAHWGAGAGAARLICGSLTPFHELEATLAAFKGAPAALVFSTGYAAALGTIPALVGPGDVVVLDKLVHACLVDGARLSGAKLRVFGHNDLDDLERILEWARSAARRPTDTGRTPGVLIVTESVYSMDGDQAPLRELVSLKERYDAWLLVDEAHATGLFGERRRGLAEACGVADRIEVQMGTLGKAIGAAGGYICGARELIELLVNRARSFIFSTAPVPAQAAAAVAGIRIVQGEEGRRRSGLLWQRIGELRHGLAGLGWPAGGGGGAPVGCASDGAGWGSAIVPLIVGAETTALKLAERLRQAGILAPAIRYPTVARGAARLRLTVSAEHTAADIEALVAALGTALADVVMAAAGAISDCPLGRTGLADGQ